MSTASRNGQVHPPDVLSVLTSMSGQQGSAGGAATTANKRRRRAAGGGAAQDGTKAEDAYNSSMGAIDPAFGQQQTASFYGTKSRQHELEGLDDDPANKPSVGTDEWHRLRRDNHKEVERRRRETINEGITEIAKIVPGCERNKGSILNRAIEYIQQLKDNEAQNIEKWTLEKLLMDQAVSELTSQNEKLKNDLQRAWREAEAWRKTCASAGLDKKKD